MFVCVRALVCVCVCVCVCVAQVIFVGEEAVDAGGVRKEFFLLIMRELLDPRYGMFRYHEESRLIWFANKVNDRICVDTLKGFVFLALISLMGYAIIPHIL